MGITRRAARICFLLLLAGAGAAAVAAKPNGGPVSLASIVPGDPRLDLRWALVESGMSPDAARRVSVILVDQVDPEAELQVLTVFWSAELWWREQTDSGASSLRMMRLLLPAPCGSAIDRMARAGAPCHARARVFHEMRVVSDRLAPIPKGARVLLRLVEVSFAGGRETVDCRELEPVSAGLDGSRGSVSCIEVTLDPETGVEVPVSWGRGR